MRAPLLVMFDLDDVLCTYNRQARAAHLARLAGTTLNAVLDAIWGSGFEALGDAGTVDATAYLRGCGERIGHPLALEEWLDARRAGMVPRPDVLGLVRRVRERAKVAVLTNNTILVADYIDRLFPELPPLFGRAIYASAGLGASKPEVACYRRCLAMLDTAPSDALFVDDLPENVAGAREAGLSAHHYTSPDALAEVLRTRGLL